MTAMKRESGSLSQRAHRMLAGQATPAYLLRHFEGSRRPYHPGSNPEGYIGLCVAENKLVAEVVAERLDRVGPVPPEVLGYDAMAGSLRFREQLARFMGRTFLGRVFEPQQISVLAGAGSVLEILFHALGDPGDGVLVPTPSYAGFWGDLELRNGLAIVPVHRASADGFRLTTELLDHALAGAGRPVRALLYTNPDNPLGTVAGREEIELVLGWAEARGLHLVVDEVYALSVFGERPFTSVARVLPALGERVHIVWAFSKDFGASGLRCGVLVSESPAVNAAVDALAYWACCSGHTQHVLGELIADETWVDGYVDAMSGRLGEAYHRVTEVLRAAGISFGSAEAGFFVLVDLRPHLAEPSWAGERELWLRMLDRAGVNLTPGAACRAAEPGFFRLCFAGSPAATVETAVRRVAAVLV
jgi:aspartate/methionine/tyrosine aminotransferase